MLAKQMRDPKPTDNPTQPHRFSSSPISRCGSHHTIDSLRDKCAFRRSRIPLPPRGHVPARTPPRRGVPMEMMLLLLSGVPTEMLWWWCCCCCWVVWRWRCCGDDDVVVEWCVDGDVAVSCCCCGNDAVGMMCRCDDVVIIWMNVSLVSRGEWFGDTVSSIFCLLFLRIHFPHSALQTSNSVWQ